jgi:hypothetical protein
MKEISRKDIEEAFKDLKLPSVSHYVGEGMSIWTINTGSHTIHTGDAGYEEFCKAMRKEGEALLKK